MYWSLSVEGSIWMGGGGGEDERARLGMGVGWGGVVVVVVEKRDSKGRSFATVLVTHKL